MTRLAVAVLASALVLPVAAAPENYTLDPHHTYPHFALDYFGFTTMMGRFDKTAGKFSIDPKAKAASLEVVVDTTSVSTGDNDKDGRPRSRDEHLRAADFFNTAEFPRMTFKSTKVTFQGDQPARVDGNLTLLGVTKPVTLTVDRFKCADHPVYKKAACGGNASGSFKRTDFGLKTFAPAVGDEIKLNISFLGFKD